MDPTSGGQKTHFGESVLCLPLYGFQRFRLISLVVVFDLLSHLACPVACPVCV